MVRVHTLATLRAERQEWRRQNNKPFPAERGRFPMSLQRLITTADGLALAGQVALIQIARGREDVPLLYKSLYRQLAGDDLPNPVPTSDLGQAAMVWFPRREGGEVRTGRHQNQPGTAVPILNFSNGLNWTREAVMYNRTWSVQMYNEARGRGLNALLNHLHLDIIISATYAAANVTNADATVGDDRAARTRTTLIAAQNTARLAKRPGSILLVSGVDTALIADAMARRIDPRGNELPAVQGITDIIEYDGYAITIPGQAPVVYDGVAPGEAFLVRPRDEFVEVIKTKGGADEQIVTGNPDVSRGIEQMIVHHIDRGVYAGLANSVQRINLPPAA